MGKTDDKDRLGELVEELLDDVDVDRDKLVDFLDNLISAHGDQPAGIAEYVAKIAAELTRQNQVRVATIKALGKSIVPENDENDDLADEIGRPFAEEIDEGSN